MEKVQSLLILLALVALAFSPVVYLWARRRDDEVQPASPAPADPTTVPGVLTPQQAVAHHLYGQAVGWDPVAMADYDTSPALQAMWFAEAGYKLQRTRPRRYTGRKA